VSEWVDWHRRYDTDAAMARRLHEVQEQIRRALDRCPPGPIGAISMCAGDGRDLLGALHGHGRFQDVHARLVEIDPELVARGRGRAAELGISGVELAEGDAGETSAYMGAVPADLVLVCGVFGNITDRDVEATVRHLPELCAPRATVIWTRGRFEPDLTPAIREWFRDAGFTEVDFVPIPDSTGSVGVHRLAHAPRAFQPERLFTFLDKQERPSTRA
jgi:hypothetical protein